MAKPTVSTTNTPKTKKFKRRTRIITHTGEHIVTDLLAAQVEYFLANAPHSAFIRMNTVNGTGHVKEMVVKQGHIASVEPLQ